MAEYPRKPLSPEAVEVLTGVVDKLTAEYGVEIKKYRIYKKATYSDAVLYMADRIRGNPVFAGTAFKVRMLREARDEEDE